MPVFDRIALLERHAGVEHRPRGSGEHRDIAEPSIYPVAEGPFDGFPIVDIDIIVDDDEMLSGVIGEMASPQRRCDLLCMAAMAFANLYAQ